MIRIITVCVVSVWLVSVGATWMAGVCAQLGDMGEVDSHVNVDAGRDRDGQLLDVCPEMRNTG